MTARRIFKMVILVALMVFFLGAGVTLTSAKETRIMRYTAQSSPKGVRSKAVQWWASEIEKRSKGAVKFKFFWSGSLLKPGDAMDGIGKGTANIGAAYGIYHPAKTPLWTVADPPFSHDDPYVGLKVMQELFKTYEPMAKELEKYNVKLLAPFVTGMTQLGTKSKPIVVPDDSRGLKIRYAGGQWAKFWKACGAVPLKLTQGEVYEGIMRGTADGTQSYIFILEAYKHWDVLKHYTLAKAGEICSYGLVVNLDDWKSLSPDLKKVFQEVSDEFVVKYAHDLLKNNERIIDLAKKNGVHFYEPDEQQIAAWKAKAEPFMKAWVKDMESKGLPGKETQETFLLLKNKYEKEIGDKGYPWEQ